MFPDQRGMLSKWFSKSRGGKRRGTARKSRRNWGYSRQSSMEMLEPRHLLTNTLYIDFGDNMGNGISLPENTTLTTAGWTTFGYLPPDNAATGLAGISWINGPAFTFAGNPTINYTPMSTVFNQKQLVFNVGQQPTNDPFQFQSGPQAQLSQYALFEASVAQMVTRMLAPFNIEVVPLFGPAGATGAGAPTRTGTNIASILARNNPLFEPNAYDPANPPTTAAALAALRGRDFDPASITGSGFQYQDAYILVGGWTRAGVQVGDDGQLGLFGAGNVDLLLPNGQPLTFADPVFTDPKYSDGGGAVAGDVIADKALANGYNGTTKVGSVVNPNVAVAAVAAQIAAQSWGLQHSSDGESKAFNPFFDTDIDLLSSSDVMRQGPGPTAGAASFPTSFDMPFFQRYSMMQGDLNQNPTAVDPAQPLNSIGALNAYDQFINDPDIGPTTFFGDYVSGTGAHNRITITSTGATTAQVEVRPFVDNSFSPASFLSSWSENLGAFTTFAAPETYSIDFSSGLPILVYLGHNDDILQIDPAITGVVFVVFGNAGVDNLQMVDNGTHDVQVDPSNINSQAFNFDTRFDTSLVLSVAGVPTMVVQTFEFDNSSTLHMNGFGNLDFEIPRFLGASIVLSNQPGSVVPTISVGQTTTIDGTAGPTALSNIVGFANIEFTNVTNVLINDPVGVTNETVTVADSIGGFAAGLKNLDIVLGPGNDKLVIATPDISLPVAGGAFTFNGGTGTDTIATDADASFTLTDPTLFAIAGGSVQLLNVETADLVGGDSANTLWILTWSKTATVDGGGGSDTLILGDAANAVTGNITMHGGSGNDNFSISNLTGTAMLFGDAGNDNFFFGLFGNIDGVTGQTSIIGGIGTDTINLNDSGNATLKDYTIGGTFISDTTGFGGVTFDSTMENIVLTGSQAANTFNVTPSLRTNMFVNGSNPTVPVGDSLLVDFTDTKGKKLTGTGIASGIWTFTSGHRPVTFTGMETIQGFNPLTGAPLLAGAGDTGKNSKPLVKVYQFDNNNAVVFSFYAYEQTFKGGVRVFLADVNNDFVQDVIVAPGPGRMGEVKVYNGQTLGTLAAANAQHFIANPASALMASFMPEGAAYKSGLYVTAGDLDGDGFADIVTSRSTGTPSVRALINNGSGTGFTSLGTFAPYTAKEKVTTGAVVAVGDVDGDGRADIVTAPGAGSVVTIKAFDGLTFDLEHQFLGFESTFKNSVSLTVGDADADGISEIMIGAGAGGGSRVRVFDAYGTMLKQFTAYTTGNKNAPLRIVAKNVGSTMTLFTSQSNDGRSRTIQGFNALTGALVDTFMDTDAAFNPGEFLG